LINMNFILCFKFGIWKKNKIYRVQFKEFKEAALKVLKLAWY
jgi:hypothetical protein